MNSQQAKRSLLGLVISLLVHGAIVGALLWNWHKPSEAASNADRRNFYNDFNGNDSRNESGRTSSRAGT